MSVNHFSFEKALEYRIRRLRSIGDIQYYKRDLIGKGSEHKTTVFKGTMNASKHEVVAIKRVERQHFVGDLTFLTAADLNHENVVSTLSVVFDKKSYVYIAMELCDGTLKQLIEGRYKGPSPGSTTKMLHQITTGLEYLHSRGVVHRNLKPQNVLISNKNAPNPPVLKLSDFCCADDGRFLYKISLPEWPVPELRTKNECYDKNLISPSVDVFLLGCLFFYVVTGNEPFNLKSLRNSFRKNGVNRLAKVVEIDNLIRRMMSEEPGKRPLLSEILQHPYIKSAYPTYHITDELSSFKATENEARADLWQTAGLFDNDVQDLKNSSKSSKNFETWPNQLLHQLPELISRSLINLNIISYEQLEQCMANDRMLWRCSSADAAGMLAIGEFAHRFVPRLSSGEFSDFTADDGSVFSLADGSMNPPCAGDYLKSPRELSPASNHASPLADGETYTFNAQVAPPEDKDELPVIKVANEMVDSITSISRFQSIFHGICIGLDVQEPCYEARKRLLQLLDPKVSTPAGNKERTERYFFHNETSAKRFKSFVFKYGVNSACEVFSIDTNAKSNRCILFAFRSLSVQSVLIDQPKLSDEAESRLRSVESLSKARSFLEDFGSHFCTCTQELGGLICYSVTIFLSSEETYEELDAMANRVLDDWLSSKTQIASLDKVIKFPQYTATCIFRAEARDYYQKLEHFEETIYNRIDDWRLIERNISFSSICSVWNFIFDNMPHLKEQASLLRDTWLNKAISCLSSSPLVKLEFKRTIHSSLLHLVSYKAVESLLLNSLGDVNEKKKQDDITLSKKLSNTLKTLEFQMKKDLFLSLISKKSSCIPKLVDQPTAADKEDHQHLSSSSNDEDEKNTSFFCFALTTMNQKSSVTFENFFCLLLQERVTLLTDEEAYDEETIEKYTDSILRLAITSTMQTIVSRRDEFEKWKTLKHHTEHDLIQAQNLGLIVVRNPDELVHYCRTVRTFTQFMHEAFTNYLLAYFISFKLPHNLLLRGQENCVYKMIIKVILIDDEYVEIRKHLNELLVIPSENDAAVCPFTKNPLLIEEYPILGIRRFNDILFATVQCKVEWNSNWYWSEESDSSDDDSSDDGNESSIKKKIHMPTLWRGSTAEALESYLGLRDHNRIYSWLIYCLKEKVLRSFRETERHDVIIKSAKFTFSTILLRSLRKATQDPECISESTFSMLEVLFSFFTSPNIAWFNDIFVKTVTTFISESSGPDASFDSVISLLYQFVSTGNHATYFKDNSKITLPHHIIFGSNNSLAYRYITYKGIKQASFVADDDEGRKRSKAFKCVLKLASLFGRHDDDAIKKQAEWFLNNLTTSKYRKDKFDRLMLTTIVAHLLTELKDGILSEQVIVRALKLDVRTLNWLTDEESDWKLEVFNGMPEIYREALESRKLRLNDLSDYSPIFQWSNIDGHTYPPVVYLLACFSEVVVEGYCINNSEMSCCYLTCEQSFDKWAAGAMRYAMCHIKDERFAVRLFKVLTSSFQIPRRWLHKAIDLARRRDFLNYTDDDSSEDKGGVSFNVLIQNNNWNAFKSFLYENTGHTEELQNSSDANNNLFPLLDIN